MKITSITVYQSSLPLEHPYWLSGGRLKFEVLDATFLKLETDEGLIGWGCLLYTSPSPRDRSLSRMPSSA